MNEQPTSPQPHEPTPQPTQTQAPTPAIRPELGPEQQPAPAPIDTGKKSKTGWILLSLSVAITLIGLYYGYILVLTAILSSYAGKNGLEAKNKPLAIIALTFTAIVFAAWAYSYVVAELG